MGSTYASNSVLPLSFLHNSSRLEKLSFLPRQWHSETCIPAHSSVVACHNSAYQSMLKSNLVVSLSTKAVFTIQTLTHEVCVICSVRDKQWHPTVSGVI